MGEYRDHHLDPEEEDEEEEEALSLCDLPLEDDNEIPEMASRSHSRRSSSEPSELFEFFSNFSSEMCSAEDIIFCGKLIPFKDLSPPHQQDKRHISFRRRSESLSGLHSSSVSRSNSINNMMRNSRSLDYSRLERFPTSKTSTESDNSMERNSSLRSNMAKRTVVKPRWYVLMFGVVKPPTEMGLRDIKSRQVRRNSLNMMLPPPVADTVKKPPVGKGSCKLLKVLSCRDPASVAVTTPLCVPPA
ncbi:uncharacterized protein LOC8285813 [Ricinus communis]|uniref:uncharacterized protein LOC8285813 n=1 Tax=Ricinus communis TaxID=3988 RepID=UPI00201AC2C5|nr:uncharacterized protein LOC8285813 [Ricinus communis]